jgi:ribosome-associated translation inhibitor RaiA
MKISYTGRHEAFPPKQRSKFEVKLQKLSKTLDRRGEKEAHVILTQERFLQKVEITVNAWDHTFVGVGSNSDVIVAAHEALAPLLRSKRPRSLAREVEKPRSRHPVRRRAPRKSFEWIMATARSP